MNKKTLGWIQIVGGVLALLFPGGTSMMSMMGLGSSMMAGGWAVLLLGVLFIITGVDNVSKK